MENFYPQDVQKIANPIKNLGDFPVEYLLQNM